MAAARSVDPTGGKRLKPVERYANPLHDQVAADYIAFRASAGGKPLRQYRKKSCLVLWKTPMMVCNADTPSSGLGALWSMTIATFSDQIL